MPADSLLKQGLQEGSQDRSQVRRTRAGRFTKGQSGNPAGRAAGSRNRATIIAEQLLDCEVRSLTRKALEMALAGDPAALRLCLDRIIGPRRERPLNFTLPPIESAADLHAAMAAITGAVGRGELTTGEAWELSQTVETFIRAIDAADFERRLQALEAGNARRP
ncbi:MAG TPA: DUF5681 domain-containing protein [Stellaceae bacterium]|nr:DUF5681 domain-containing protein [Stellaceae bacterium]